MKDALQPHDQAEHAGQEAALQRSVLIGEAVSGCVEPGEHLGPRQESSQNPVLFHFGSFETTFLNRMCRRYGRPRDGSRAAKAIESSVNVLSVIYGQVYFPTFTNGLKEIAGFLGFRWSDSTASGLKTIVLRDHWETSHSVDAKQALLAYNSEDCEALERVVHGLAEVLSARPMSEDGSQTAVVQAATMRREHPHGFKRKKITRQTQQRQFGRHDDGSRT